MEQNSTGVRVVFRRYTKPQAIAAFLFAICPLGIWLYMGLRSPSPFTTVFMIGSTVFFVSLALGWCIFTRASQSSIHVFDFTTGQLKCEQASMYSQAARNVSLRELRNVRSAIAWGYRSHRQVVADDPSGKRIVLFDLIGFFDTATADYFVELARIFVRIAQQHTSTQMQRS